MDLWNFLSNDWATFASRVLEFACAPYTTDCKHCTNIFGLSAADRMCRSGAVDIICIDSVSALTPRAEIEVFFLVYLSRIWANMMSVSSHFFWVCD
jgi:hypothetical protein